MQNYNPVNLSLPYSLTFIMTLSDLYKILICTVKIKIDNIRSRINSLNPAQICSLIGDYLQALLICTYRYLPYSLTVIMTLYKILICTVKVKSEGLDQFEIPNKIRFRQAPFRTVGVIYLGILTYYLCNLQIILIFPYKQFDICYDIKQKNDLCSKSEASEHKTQNGNFELGPKKFELSYFPHSQ